jgi:LPXTG-motif cell wall-anchored protein
VGQAGRPRRIDNPPGFPKMGPSDDFGILPLMQADSVVRLVALILLVAVVGIIFLRRKKKKDASDDEF